MNRIWSGPQVLSLLFASMVMAVAGPSLAQSPAADSDAAGAKAPQVVDEPAAANSDSPVKGQKKQDWKPLRDSWVVCQFGGDGPVEIGEKLIKLGIGDPLSGIRWEGDVARENFEVELEARRVEGFDFFCALTFPVAADHVSFVLGGWGGGIVGISSIDGNDASQNDTTQFRNFHNEQWYKVRVRVDPHEIRCWIDDKPAAEVVRQGHEFDIRYEMEQCLPLGVAAFQCKSEIRNMRIRRLNPDEIAAAKQKSAAQPQDSGQPQESGR